MRCAFNETFTFQLLRERKDDQRSVRDETNVSSLDSNSFLAVLTSRENVKSAEAPRISKKSRFLFRRDFCFTAAGF